ncbi:MAG: hypothetical protein WA376_03470 [Terrimicrobiaceae bacterium]
MVIKIPERDKSPAKKYLLNVLWAMSWHAVGRVMVGGEQLPE